MRVTGRLLAIVLAILFAASAAHAQDHVVSKKALSQAIQDRVTQAREDREAVLSWLQREEVQRVAANAGISLKAARAAVSTLDPNALHELATAVRDVNDELAGGASTVTISTTTIIIALLLLILIVLVAD